MPDDTLPHKSRHFSGIFLCASAVRKSHIGNSATQNILSSIFKTARNFCVLTKETMKI